MRQVWDLYKRTLAILSPSAKSFLLVYAFALGILAMVDAVVLGLLALLVAPVAIGEKVSLPFIGELDMTGLMIAIGVLCIFVILKGVVSLVVLLWGTRRGADYEIQVGSRLLAAFIRSPWESRLARNSADIVRFTDSSVSVFVTGFLLPGATLISEVLTFLSILAVVAIAQPIIALTTMAYLGLIGLMLYVWVAREARRAGEVNLHYSILTSRLILAMVASMKEIALRGKMTEVEEVVEAARRRSTRARANLQFLGEIPRYALESGIIGGFALIGAVGFAIGGATGAITSVALFSIAGFRMAPSVVRTQSTLSMMMANSPNVRIVLDETYATERATEEFRSDKQLPLENEPRRLVLKNVSFTYQGANVRSLDDLSLTIEMGSTVAFVGPSGSGKSTVIDMILGFLQPQSGSIYLDEQPLADFIDSWRRRLGYVPQDVSIFDGTVAENVALSWTGEYDEAQVRSALRQASLLETIDSRPDGILGRVGERGLALSGGQRQRLGIARALYPNPIVLVMDEATSALDVKTEAEVNEAIAALRGETTLILVAHRLSTIMYADEIFYLRDGKVVDHGSFQDLVARVPDFAQQAELSGLA